MKVVLEVKVRNRAEIDDKQCGFRKIKGATDAILLLDRNRNNFWLKERELSLAFLNLEKLSVVFQMLIGGH